MPPHVGGKPEAIEARGDQLEERATQHEAPERGPPLGKGHRAFEGGQILELIRNRKRMQQRQRRGGFGRERDLGNRHVVHG
jgi:hypothetical protein